MELFNIQNLIDAIEEKDPQSARDMQAIIDRVKPLPLIKESQITVLFAECDIEENTFHDMDDFISYCVESDITRASDFRYIIQGDKLDLKEIEDTLVNEREDYVNGTGRYKEWRH